MIKSRVFFSDAQRQEEKQLAQRSRSRNITQNDKLAKDSRRTDVRSSED